MRFGSKEWLDGFVRELARAPDLQAALSGLGRDAAVVVLRDPPAWPETIAAWAEQENGRIARYRILDDEDEILELEPAYVVRAPYRIFRALLTGADPVKAALSGALSVEGDLEALVRRARYRYLVDRALAAVATELP